MNILISCGTSTGNLTFTRSLLSMVNPGKQVLSNEDAVERFPRLENAVAPKADHSAQAERTPVRPISASLPVRPDRIVLGYLRGAESRTFDGSLFPAAVPCLARSLCQSRKNTDSIFAHHSPLARDSKGSCKGLQITHQACIEGSFAIAAMSAVRSDPTYSQQANIRSSGSFRKIE